MFTLLRLDRQVAKLWYRVGKLAIIDSKRSNLEMTIFGLFKLDITFMLWRVGSWFAWVTLMLLTEGQKWVLKTFIQLLVLLNSDYTIARSRFFLNIINLILALGFSPRYRGAFSLWRLFYYISFRLLRMIFCIWIAWQSRLSAIFRVGIDRKNWGSSIKRDNWDCVISRVLLRDWFKWL